MIFIFAGLGILGAVPLLLPYLLWAWAGLPTVAAGALVVVLGVPVYFLGIYLNRTRPARDLARRMDERSAQLHALADAGQFHRGPGYAPPTSLEQAHQQADDLAVEEYAAVKNKVGNRNTLFWIPLQYWAFIDVAIGLIVLIRGALA